MIRRAPAIALGLGSTLLAATWTVLDPGQLGAVAAGVALLAAVLCIVHAASRVSVRRRATLLRRRLVEQLGPAQSLNPRADPYQLPWYAILTTDGGPAPTVRIGRDAVFVRLSAAAPGPAPILATLRALRPRRPISGALLAIPADRLLTSPPERIDRAAAALAAGLDALCAALCVRFPVTVVLTHCKALRGFTPLAAALRQGHLPGWSNPAPLDSPGPDASFDEPIAAIAADLRRACLSLLTEPGDAPLTRAHGLLALPDKVASLAPRLRSFARAISAVQCKGGRPRFFLRGLYLGSGRLFLQELLAQRLLPERRLVCSPRRPARAERPIAAIAAAALLAPALAVALTMVLRAASQPAQGSGGAVASGAMHAAPHPSQVAPAAPAIDRRPPPHRSSPSWGSALHLAASHAATHALDAARGALGAIGRLRQQFPRLLAATLASPEAVMARADAMAGAPDGVLPALPCTSPPVLPARFGSAVARQMFADYATLAGAAPPSGRRGLRAAYSEYAAEFVRVWSAQADPPIAPLSWAELRPALAAIKPAKANRDARDLFFAVGDALALVPSELGQDQAVSAARAAMAGDTAAMDRPWFDEACRRTLVKWAALEPATARAAIIRLSRARFEADYLAVYAEPGSGAPGSRYWSSLILAALSSIADSSAPRADAAAFIQNTRAFPLCSTSPRTLAPADLIAARDFAAAIIRTGLSASAPDDSLPIARGTRTDFPRINDQLARLVGETAFDDDARDQWAYRLRAVLAFLDAPQTCRLVLLGPAQQVPIDDAVPAAVLVPRFDIALGAAPPQGPFFTDRAAEVGATFDIPGPTLAFTFRNDQGPVARVELPAPWNAITLLHQPGASIDDASDPSGRLVKAPLIFTDAAGRRLCYWIALRFERPPPALAQWPSDADWPD